MRRFVPLERWTKLTVHTCTNSRVKNSFENLWNNANKNTAKVLIQLVDFPSWISFGILKNSEEALALGVFLQGLTVLPWGILSNSLIFIFDVFRSYFIQRDNEGKEKFQVEKFNKASGMIQMKTNIRLLGYDKRWGRFSFTKSNF